MAATYDPNDSPVDLDEKLVMVSCDTHIGPRVREDLRQYCEKKYLQDFDDFVKYLDDKNIGGVDALRLTTGHYDVDRRLKDLDQDGIAAEVIFHGSQNGEPVPFNVSDASPRVENIVFAGSVRGEASGRKVRR